MLIGLNFILMHVSNVAEATTFYTEKLGLTLEGQSPDFAQFNQPSGNGAIFALSKGDPTPSSGTELWWYVDDADATLATLQAKGVEVVDMPKDEPFGRTFSIKAPEGYTLYMLQLARQG